MLSLILLPLALVTSGPPETLTRERTLQILRSQVAPGEGDEERMVGTLASSDREVRIASLKYWAEHHLDYERLSFSKHVDFERGRFEEPAIKQEIQQVVTLVEGAAKGSDRTVSLEACRTLCKMGQRAISGSILAPRCGNGLELAFEGNSGEPLRRVARATQKSSRS